MSQKVIGILKNEVSLPLEQSLFGALLKARELGYEIVASDNLEILQPSRLSGLVYMQRREMDLSMLRRLEANGLPVVSCNIAFEGIHSVCPDNTGGIRAAVQHLSSLGHRRIAFVRGPRGVPNAEERMRGFIEAMENAHMEFDPSLVVNCGFDFQGTRHAVATLLSNRHDFTAIMCSSDKIAVGAIGAIHQAGQNVPEDIAVVAFGNAPEISGLLEDRLTTVNYPLFQIGIRAIEVLHQKISGQAPTHCDERLDCLLIQRDTCGGSILRLASLPSDTRKETRLLEYLLGAGSDLDDDAIESLVNRFHQKIETNRDPVGTLIATFLEAIQAGLNPFIFQSVITRIAHEFGYWSTGAKGQPTEGQVLDKLREISRDSILFLHRIADDILARFSAATESLFNQQTEADGQQGVLETLRAIQQQLRAKHFSLLLFESPLVSLNSSSGESVLWTSDETYGLKKKTIRFDNRTARFSDLLPASRSLRCAIACDIKSPEGIIGILFLDADTEFALEYHRLAPLISAMLQRTMLYESLKAQTRELAQQTAALQQANRQAERSREDQEDARRQAELANQAKSEFLTVISHEIRTPLSNIIGMTELALDNAVEPAQSECLKISLDSANTLLTIVDDLRDFSRIESGELKLRYSNLDLERCVSEVLISLKSRADKKSLRLGHQVSADIPADLAGDIVRIKQILTNLVSNAIDFTEEGSVEVHVRAQIQNDAETITLFEVSDTGIGMPEAKRVELYNIMEQANSSDSRLYDGTGLGLAITSRLIRQMKGDFSIASEQGRGSAFSFTLPLKRLAAAPDKPNAPGIRILVCSPTYDLKSFLGAEPNYQRHQVQSVEKVADAINLWREAFREKRSFPIVIIEREAIQQTDRDLLEETAFFKPSQLAVISPTSAGEPWQRLDRNGLNVINEPLRKEDLLQALDQMLQTAPKAAPKTGAQAKATESQKTGYKILIVDDNASNQLVAQSMLEREGHSIVKAFNGEQGLEMWKRAAFDVILMDVQMPGMDGWEATRIIRDQERLTGKRTPIIAVTSHAIGGYEKKCFEAGMDGYITKPIERESFLKAVREAPEKYSRAL